MQFSVWKKLVMYDLNGESKQTHGVASVSQGAGELFLLPTLPQLLWYLRS